jgi:hypothetical protein
VINPDYNISATKPPNGVEPFGNGNKEYPWARTAGLEGVDTKHFKVLNAYYLPPGKSIEWWEQPSQVRQHKYNLIQWSFPVDTVFVEILQLPDSKGNWFTFEVRTRTKVGDTEWEPELYRPYRNRGELQQMMDVKRVGNYRTRTQFKLEGPFVIKDEHPTKTVINRTALYSYVPEMDEDLAKSILDQKFLPCSHEVYDEDETQKTQARCYAPTRAKVDKVTLNVVPPAYNAAYLKVSNSACNTCHSTVQKLVDDFDFVRDWYGHVRGSDKIFSFHPFDPECIAPYGGYKEPKLRKDLPLVKRK